MTGTDDVTFDAIGSRWQISSTQALDPAVLQLVLARADAFDATYSRFRPDSLVAELARRPGSYRFPADAGPLLALYRRLYDATEGAVTPLVGDVLEHLGYGRDYRLQRSPGTRVAPAWDDVLTVDGTDVRTTSPVLLDLGAVGKGFLVDQVADLLTAAGLTDFVVDASGDLRHQGSRAERVGLEDPRRAGHVIGSAALVNTSLCASATQRRSWGDGLHHIVDPRSGEPVSGVLASWVTHPSCAVADGLATALFLAEPGQLARHFSFGYVRMLADGSVSWSRDFAGEIFT